MRANAGRSGMVWLFDLDNTLHDAGAFVFPALKLSMRGYIQQQLQVDEAEAQRLNLQYWHRYGATLLGLMRHHGVDAAHFLHDTHRLPGLEPTVRGHRHDMAALARLPGRRFILTNAPRHYALRVLGALGIGHLFDGVFAIEDMAMFGQLRPKPDAACCAAWPCACACRPAAACWWKTRWCTRSRRAAWAWARCGCSASPAARPCPT